MMRLLPSFTWIAFSLCLGVVCTAMVWMSLTTLRLEQAEFQAQQQSESERLALWRMDSAIVPLITRESSRPHRVYSDFYLAEHAYSKRLTRVKPGEIQVPSPLLTHESPYIRLHFQFDPDGRLTSPQVPSAKNRDLAESNYTTHARVAAAAKVLAELRGKLTRQALLQILSIEESVPLETPQQLALMQGRNPNDSVHKSNAIERVFAQQSGVYRARRNIAEFHKRVQSTGNSAGEYQRLRAKERVHVGPMKAVWAGKLLLLARETRVDGKQYIQGCALDWPALREWLRGEIADLLPDARLLPQPANVSGDNQLRLASIPVKLVPGEAVGDSLAGWTPMQLPLLIAWVCIGLAAVAVAALLLASVRLSERRGTFVSAVTHELRTPLTTFRMYTDMLCSGKIVGEKQRTHYLQTLRSEAERLGHLVENVLSYARLESPRKRSVRENICLNDVLRRHEDSLRRRAEQADMQLEIQCDLEEHRVVHADASAVERILVNLVDNACKYAAEATDRRIHVRSAANGSHVVLSVRDHGPGLSGPERKRMFLPFSKSDSDAANSAPGVGLGLALCRRLAKSMGGDLRLSTTVTDGACFELLLPK